MFVGMETNLSTEQEQDRQVRTCTNLDDNEGCNLGDARYPEGYYFCGKCGAQFDCPTHGADLPDADLFGSSLIVCCRCGKTTTDPDLWDPEAGTGDIYCNRCWDLR